MIQWSPYVDLIHLGMKYFSWIGSYKEKNNNFTILRGSVWFRMVEPEDRESSSLKEKIQDSLKVHDIE